MMGLFNWYGDKSEKIGDCACGECPLGTGCGSDDGEEQVELECRQRDFYKEEVEAGRDLIIGKEHVAELSMECLLDGEQKPYVCYQYFIDDENRHIGEFSPIFYCSNYKNAAKMIKFLDTHVED